MDCKIHGVVKSWIRLSDWLALSISLILSDVDHFSYVYWSLLFLLWRNVCCCCCQVTSVVSNSMWPPKRKPTRLPLPWDSPSKNTGVGCLFFSNAWKWKVKGKSLSRVRLLATPWNVAYQAPPSMRFSRQEYWSGLPLPSPEEMSIEAFYTFFKLSCLPAVVLKLQLLFYMFWILSCYSDTKFAGTSSHSIGCLSVDCWGNYPFFTW